MSIRIAEHLRASLADLESHFFCNSSKNYLKTGIPIRLKATQIYSRALTDNLG